MSSETKFQIVTTFAALFTAVSALLHVVLLASDSPEYRRWILIQIALQSIAVVLLWLVRRYNPIALVMLFAVSVPHTYINAVYTNYGSAPFQVTVVTIIWFFYGYLVYGVRERFQGRIEDA